MQYSSGICKMFKEIYTCYGVIPITVGVQQRQENGEREKLLVDSLLTGYYLCTHKCARFVLNVC